MTNIQPPPEAAMRTLRRTDRTNQNQRLLLILSSLAIGVALMAAGFAWGTRGDAVDAANANAGKIEALNKTVDAQSEFIDKCKGAKGDKNPACAVAPTPPAAVQPEKIDGGEKVVGLQESEVKNLVSAEVIKHSLNVSPTQTNAIVSAVLARVPQPKPGQPGRTPTQAELRTLVGAAVQIQCANSSCVGPSGPGGAEGKPGADAPPVTDQQLNDRLKAFCEARDDKCVGPQGPRGDDSKVPGPQGRGIISIVCQEDGKWLFTFDKPDADGSSTALVDGPCRVEPVITP